MVSERPWTFLEQDFSVLTSLYICMREYIFMRHITFAERRALGVPVDVAHEEAISLVQHQTPKVCLDPGMFCSLATGFRRKSKHFLHQVVFMKRYCTRRMCSSYL